MNRIDKKFIQLKKEGRTAFIAFITAGYPDLATTARLVPALERKGVDIIELGVPFSDPMADGPVIQASSEYSLKKGTNLVKILELVKRLRRSIALPVCLMTYYNPVFCFGERRFVDRAVASGVDGVIIPDLPPEEAPGFIRYADKKGLANICLLAPTSSESRIKKISGISRGFIYYVSLTGVTGGRKTMALDLRKNLARIKRVTSKPVCVGFGISSPGQARSLRGNCDGVIIGSAIVKKIGENIGSRDLVPRVAGFAGRFHV